MYDVPREQQTLWVRKCSLGHQFVSEQPACPFCRVAELDKALLDARVLMRDLWRLDPNELPSDDLAQRCKAFMGGG